MEQELDFTDDQIVEGVFVCYNEKCEANEEFVTKQIKYKEQYEDHICEKCKGDLHFKGLKFDAEDEIRVSYNYFKSMNKDDQRKKLLQRSHKAFLKDTKEKKQFLDRQI